MAVELAAAAVAEEEVVVVVVVEEDRRQHQVMRRAWDKTQLSLVGEGLLYLPEEGT